MATNAPHPPVTAIPVPPAGSSSAKVEKDLQMSNERRSATFAELYSTADALDYMSMLIGSLCAAGTGCAMPIVMVRMQIRNFL